MAYDNAGLAEGWFRFPTPPYIRHLHSALNRGGGQVDDGRAMNAAKHGRIHNLLQFSDATSQEVSFWPHVETYIVVGSLDPIDFRQANKDHVPGALNGKEFQLPGLISAPRDLLLGAIDGQSETGIFKGL